MSKKSGKKSLRIEDILEKEILQFLKQQHHKNFNYKQVAAALKIADHEVKKMVGNVLHDLVEKDLVTETSRGKFKYNQKVNVIVGRIEITKKGTGFILVENAKDLFISSRNTFTAFNGDLVKVKAIPSKSGKGRTEFRVIDIVERKRKVFTGIVELTEKFAFVKPDDIKIPVDFYVPFNKMVDGIVDGQKVVVELEEWDNPDKNPIGKITQVLGFPGENEAEIHAVMAAYDLPFEFPDEVTQAAKKLYDSDWTVDIKNRKDFRDTTTITIDPHDAKDFDDALSFKKLKDNTFEIGIHIADVTHFLKEDSILDKEAIKRATSVYLVDRVIPMLPEVLSNDLCSLRPHEDRFAFSAVFTMDENGKVLEQWYGKSVIHSNRRFAYEEAQEIIEGKDGDFAEEIRTMDAIAKNLRKKRVEQGAIEFGGTEVKFVLDENAKPKEVVLKTSKDANKLIEEFMLLANRKVAEFVGKRDGKNLPFVYRVHDKPDEEKLKTLKDFLSHFGLKLQHVTGKAAAFALNRLLKSVEGKAFEGIVKNLAIRSMAKASYSPENIGHYGLAFEHYSHFTSPIRRYPDVMVHRLLQHYLTGGKATNDNLDLKCKHCSIQEKNATDAERTSIKYMQVLFMKDRIGEEMEGVITGVTPWGIFVELEDTRCEGLVAMEDMDDDFYQFDERKHRLVGQRYGKELNFADRVLVKVQSADIIEKKLNFKLIDVFETF